MLLIYYVVVLGNIDNLIVSMHDNLHNCAILNYENIKYLENN